MKKLLGVAALLLAATVLVPVALAGPITLGFETLLGGGPGGSEWDVDNDGGTDNGLPSGGSEDGSPGLNVNDANFTGGQSDAFDNGLMVFVDDVIFAAPGDAADRTGETLTAGPVTMSGLDVSMEYFALSSEAKLRTFVTFENPSGSPIAATVSWVTNMGSDSGTVVPGTSSGDTAFTTADRWVVTSDSITTADDPVNTHVLFGPGSPAVTPSSVSQTVFEDSDTDGILAEYDITVPAGETRHLLFFNQLSLTNGDALTDAAAQFDANPPLANELLSDLSEDQLFLVLNWDFAAPEPTDITLDPPTATNEIGSDHTVTATVTDGLGFPTDEADADFNIIDGPNADEPGQITALDANGQADFTYTGDGGAGTDTIQACAVDFPVCATATKTWEEPAATPTPTPTVLAATPTPTPSPTVAAAVQLPATGGAPSGGGSVALPWLAAIAASIALIGSGSAWFAHQRRRVR